jgi:hypothetical protein
MPGLGRSVPLQTAFLNEACPDRRNVRLAIAQRVRRRVDRDRAMRRGRAKNELCIGQRLEVDRLARRLESREFAMPPFA